MTFHLDAREDRRPLPLVEMEGLEGLVEPILRALSPVRGRVATGYGHQEIGLFTDSDHLRGFFLGNWGGFHHSELAQATIVALRGESVPGAPEILPGRRYINPARTLIVSVKHEYYGNVKISVRGLCSATTQRLEKGGFLHGASIAIGNLGLVIGGTSGAGKTTITRALFDLLGSKIRIINDDWGWADQDTKTICFTGEPNLHMKYRSVRSLAPALRVSPAAYPSENYDAEFDDGHARLLIPRDVVFDHAVADRASFDAYVVLVRDATSPFFIRTLTADDIHTLETAEYSAFYQRYEYFLDGSLVLLNEAEMAAERRRFSRLLANIPSVLINNSSAPSEAAHAIVEHLAGLGWP